MKSKLISLISTIGLLMTVGAVGATSAQAETRSIASPTFLSPIVVKPNFVPPTGGGDTGPAPSQGSAGRQVCSVVQYASDTVGLWQKVGNVVKWVQVVIYSSAIICSVIYN